MTPGPGSYESNFLAAMKSNPGWKMGTAKRNDDVRAAIKKGTPDPAAYNPNASKILVSASDAAWSFGTGKRKDLGINTKTPGPGGYNVPSKAVEGRKFNMGLKLDNQSSIGVEQRKTAGNPGAGNYNPDYSATKQKLPAFSMQSRHSDSKRMKVPGPGAYNSPDTK